MFVGFSELPLSLPREKKLEGWLEFPGYRLSRFRGCPQPPSYVQRLAEPSGLLTFRVFDFLGCPPMQNLER